MATLTQTYQGTLVSAGQAVTFNFPGGVTWMNTWNLSAIDSPSNGDCKSARWQLGMGANCGLLNLYVSASTADNLTFTSTAGFTYFDSSAAVPGVIHATVTAVSTASIPVVTNSGTNALSAGQIVRLFNIAGAQQLGGIDFTVGLNTLNSTHFSLDYMAQLGVAGTTGSWMLVNFDPIFYPRRRSITAISQASQAVVTLSVTHGYQIGQLVRMIVPAVFGMTQINGLQATIVDVDTTNNTITIDIDSTAFTAFAFPVSADVPFSPAEVTPIGEDTAYALSQGVNILSDATINESSTGLIIAAGAAAPMGADNDVIFWEAGTTFSQEQDATYS